MEYNFHTMGNETGLGEGRRTAGENIYEPCDSLPTKYQPACYHEQVEWWESIVNLDWQKISQLCKTLSDNQENSKACYLAIGHYAAIRNNFNADLAAEICSILPTAETRALCSGRAAWLIINEPGERTSDPYILCKQLESPYNKQCEDRLNSYKPLNKT